MKIIVIVFALLCAAVVLGEVIAQIAEKEHDEKDGEDDE